MIDGSEKHKLQLAFGLQSSPVFEKRSNYVEKNTTLDDHAETLSSA